MGIEPTVRAREGRTIGFEDRARHQSGTRFHLFVAVDVATSRRKVRAEFAPARAWPARCTRMGSIIQQEDAMKRAIMALWLGAGLVAPVSVGVARAQATQPGGARQSIGPFYG